MPARSPVWHRINIRWHCELNLLALINTADPLNPQTKQSIQSMHTTKNFKNACISAILLCVSLESVQAASITNLDAAVNLNLAGSWVAGRRLVPAMWRCGINTVQINTTKALGANLGWAGTGHRLDLFGLITISAGNTLTLGSFRH